jgi:death-on-curing protein
VIQEPESIDYLSLEDLFEIAHGILGTALVRDVGLLAAAASRPQATAFGNDAYPRFHEKAAALLHSLARNHALVDGNKRLAWSATRIFCLMNGFDLVMSVDDAEAMVLGAASGDMDVPKIASQLYDALG